MMKTILLCLFAIIEMTAGIFMIREYLRHKDRSRLILAIFFIFSTFGAAMKMLLAGQGVSDTGERPLLKPSTIFIGFSIFFFLTLYPIEVMKPNWLNVKRVLLILSPYLIFTGMYAIVAASGTHYLYSTYDILQNIDKSEVFLRLVLSLLFIPYGIWVMLLQYNWRESGAPIHWMRVLVCVIMLMTVTFSCSRLFQIQWTMYLHLLLYVILTAVILHLEIRVRFNVPHQEAAVPVSVEAAQPSGPGERLRDRLEEALENPEVWQNPDLTRDRLCNMLGTNATYLQKAIKSMGYTSYSDMINRKRIEYVCRELKSGKQENIQDIFYRAGYRSRVTAWRNFTAITGTSPASWDLKSGL
ncbi:MAG: helix-turn-helix domain-containing protein [Candidatus Cryptobacteroides sp.]